MEIHRSVLEQQRPESEREDNEKVSTNKEKSIPEEENED